jgi:hypothetical protein
MRHPTDGTLRRLLDEPAGVPDAEREHVAGCPVCLGGLAAAQQDAAATATVLHTDVSPDVDRAWQRLSATVAADGRYRAPALPPVPAPATASAGRWRAVLRRPAVAVLGVLLVVTGAGAAAAADWVQIFRAEQVTPVPVSSADLVRLPDLSAYGTLEVTEQPDVHPVAGAAAAEQATGLAVPEVGALPRGVTGQPAFTVGTAGSATFTFSADRAAQAAAAAGQTLPPPPAGLDGSRFRLAAGPGVAEVWSESRGVPALVVARVVAPTAFSSGVPFSTARDYLLSLPGLPDDLAAQLRGFAGDGTTLPLPVPVDLATSSTAEVGGRPATVLTARDGSMAGVVWVQNGVVTGVAGTLSVDEILSVARGLR